MKGKITALLFMLLMLVACGTTEEVQPTEDDANDRLKVYTTIYPLQFFTEQIGGDLVDVINIIPVGSDAHTFEPTAKTMTEVVNGDLFIYNGAGIEGFVDSFLPILEKENIQIIKAVEGVELRHTEHEHDHDHDHEDGDHHGHDHGDYDPHVWLDPILSIKIAENIKNELLQLLPEESEKIEANFATLSNELEAIDEEFREMLTEISKEQFLVSHAGYGYWEERYGIEQISVTGLSPTNEPSVKHMDEIIKQAEEIGASYIAFEKNMTVKVAETVQNEANLDVVYLYNLESLLEENITNDEDYFDIMRNNIDALRLLLK